MTEYEIDYSYSDVYRDTLRRESSYLRKIAMKFAYQYIGDSFARMMFLNDIEQLIARTELEVSSYCLSLSAGLDNISDEIERLELQDNLLRNRSVMQYALFEIIRKQEESEENNKLTLKQVGFVSGAMQIYGGGASCVGSVGTLCSSLGVGMVSQGVNSMIENGYYLLFREEYSGPVRNGYRATSKALGYGDNEADIFYNVVDLSLSGASLLKPVLKEDSWKLFHYIKSDFITSWQSMGRLSLTSEFFFDGVTFYSTYDLYKEKNKSE
ncbi:DUF4225 domain-containing protein [Proteus vulgaris]|uniref:DUF4225 domain-containing protein n=1 Tax=Proteus vulgaris TaxID=585 RepID=A0A6G6SFH0_PROVU|nr:DUF4225 domain-containing protein [Proteus vulgaris]QIF93177.1 DUF4225 domain-containing protein [Proteus vulgaris]WIF73165.1 DUF4225 domain-containing protein [Proteus vulgaris]CRL66183.1 hypothetical protein BN1805_03997 [Proteus vulgaris]